VVVERLPNVATTAATAVATHAVATTAATMNRSHHSITTAATAAAATVATAGAVAI
jgi:hypothetical protein